MLFMASQKVAIVDLGRTWRIRKITIVIRGEGHPGLAGIEIHESVPGAKAAKSGFKPAPVGGRLSPDDGAMRLPAPALGARWAALACAADQFPQRWRKAIIGEMPFSTRKARS
jgi:hypothetical protein